MRPSGSPKTVAASSNETVCLAKFAAAFFGSHSNSNANLHYTCTSEDSRRGTGRTVSQSTWPDKVVKPSSAASLNLPTVKPRPTTSPSAPSGTTGTPRPPFRAPGKIPRRPPAACGLSRSRPRCLRHISQRRTAGLGERLLVWRREFFHVHNVQVLDAGLALLQKQPQFFDGLKNIRVERIGSLRRSDVRGAARRCRILQPRRGHRYGHFI